MDCTSDHIPRSTIHVTWPFLSGFHCILCFPIQLSFYRNHILMMHLNLHLSHLRFTSRIPCRRPSILIRIVCRTRDLWYLHSCVFLFRLFLCSVCIILRVRIVVNTIFNFFNYFLILFDYVVNILTTAVGLTYSCLWSSLLHRASLIQIIRRIFRLPWWPHRSVW